MNHARPPRTATFAPRLHLLRGARSDGDRRRIYFGTSLGDGVYLNGAAVVYCLEDRVKEW